MSSVEQFNEFVEISVLGCDPAQYGEVTVAPALMYDFRDRIEVQSLRGEWFSRWRMNFGMGSLRFSSESGIGEA